MVVFFLPTAINAAHDLLNHEHAVCNSKIEHHIHKKDVDCKIHLFNQSSFLLDTKAYVIAAKTIIFKVDSVQYSFLKNHYQLSFSLRGPPLHVQS